ncbi:MAG: hypothetical protein AAF598_05600 [Bacteroidota bacterium]
MKRINCLVQAHQFSKAQIKAIEAGFKALYHQHYRAEKLQVFWMIFPEGNAFSERKASNGIIILIEVDNDISKEKREELMSVYSQFLFTNYQVSPLDTVITVANTPWVDDFFAAQKQRIHPSSRTWITLRTLFTAFSSKLANGFLRLRIKY